MSATKEIHNFKWIGKIQPDKSVELGDCIQRESMYMLGLKLEGAHTRKLFRFILSHLEHPKYPGFYRRSPDTDWSGDYDRMSRDQSIPLVAAMGAVGLYKHIFFHLLSHILRLGFFTNIRRNGTTKLNHGTKKYVSDTPLYNYNPKPPDFAGPSFWALYLRGFWPLGLALYPVLCVLDLSLLVHSLLWRYHYTHDDCLSYLILTRYSRSRLPTPLSYLALRIENKQDLKTKLDVYFDPATEYRPIADIWLRLI